MAIITKSVLALDVGDKRVGLALASLAARLPQPYKTLERGDGFWDRLKEVIDVEMVGNAVIGLPRNLNSEDTSQTSASQIFANEFRQHFGDVTVDFQDEALTSHQAEVELRQRGKPYDRGDVDALAASYILSDWLAEHPEPVA